MEGILIAPSHIQLDNLTGLGMVYLWYIYGISTWAKVTFQMCELQLGGWDVALDPDNDRKDVFLECPG